MNHRRAAENSEKRSLSMVAELTTTFRSRRSRENALEPAEQKINGQAALVRFIDDQRVVGAQQPVV
ncbi:MAG: hypothetical protein QM744_09555 [Mesorhizobium sp.]